MITAADRVTPTAADASESVSGGAERPAWPGNALNVEDDAEVGQPQAVGRRQATPRLLGGTWLTYISWAIAPATFGAAKLVPLHRAHSR